MRFVCAALVAVGCARAPVAPCPCGHEPSALRPAQGPYAESSASPTAEPPKVSLAAERDVLLAGRVPQVDVFAREIERRGEYRDTSEFTVLGPDGRPVPRRCDRARRPHGSRGLTALSFECKPMPGPGVYTVRVDPARLGVAGKPAEVRVRVLSALPRTPPPPPGWGLIAVADRLPMNGCFHSGEVYRVAVEAAAPVMTRVEWPDTARLPVELKGRMSAGHAAVVRYVFEDRDGWLVLFDHGEFGGGVEWYPRAGGEPRSIEIGDHDVPQNVNRAVAVGGAIYLLQGLSHMWSSTGQMAKLWREHDHFTSHVIARYESEPFDWIREPDGSWLVATAHDGLWRTTEGGTATLVARFPDLIWYGNSLARAPNGTIYVGARNGVLRLTPVWPETPRYAADWLVPPDVKNRECR